MTAQCIVDGQTTSHRTLEDAWRTAQQAKGPATVKILGDCTLAKLFVVQSGCQITLDLNGCTLDASAFEVAAGGQFTLTDTAAADAAKQGTITGTKVGAVNVADGGTFIMQGGTLTGNSAVNGGAVNVAYGGTFLMQGGVLTGNTAANGGAVYNDGAFVMTGGKILDNRAQQGGGVYNAGAMRVEGGSIIGNKANEGGGVFQTGPRLELANDAVISGNVRPADGAADNLCLDWDAETDGETHTLSIGAMGENAKVFLNSKREPTLDSPTTISANSNVTASNLAKLHADNPDRCLQLWDGTVYLNVHKLMEYQTERALYRKPTCLGNAVYYYSCDSCGMLSPDETFTAQGTALGHRWRPYMAFYADHFKHYHVCSGCNLQDAGEPHVWNIPEATETESKYCTICNYVLQAATGHAHELELVLGSAPDCVTNGILSHYECESGKHYEDANGLREIPDPAANELIPAVGHSWTPTFLMENADAERHYLGCSACGDMDVGMLHEWNVVTATLETDKHCTVCGYVAEPRLEHAHQGIFVPERPARCGVDGEKAYYRCDCGMCFHDEACTQPIEDFGTWKVIHAQPHKWSANYLPAYSDAQHHYHVCTVCGALDAGEDHLWTEAEGGGRRCEVCGYGGAAAPLTGDSTPLGTYLALLVLSGAGLAAAITRRKKQRI